MSKELKELKERLHDLNYVLTNEEIEELADICGEHSNSWCPLVEFFNDIFFNKNKDYNKNQAFKDLWLIALIVSDKEEELKALEIIKEKKWLVEEILDAFYEDKDKYDLLKEVLL